MNTIEVIALSSPLAALAGVWLASYLRRREVKVEHGLRRNDEIDDRKAAEQRRELLRLRQQVETQLRVAEEVMDRIAAAQEHNNVPSSEAIYSLGVTSVLTSVPKARIRAARISKDLAKLLDVHGGLISEIDGAVVAYRTDAKALGKRLLDTKVESRLLTLRGQVTAIVEECLPVEDLTNP